MACRRISTTMDAQCNKLTTVVSRTKPPGGSSPSRCEGQASYSASRSRPGGPKREAERAESGTGVLGVGEADSVPTS